MQGLRVPDVSTIVAAPTAAALLADYGAEVTKAGRAAAGSLPFF